MGWFQYYRLLEQYKGDLTRASKMELEWAAQGNPNTPEAARKLAEEKYNETHRRFKIIDCNGVEIPGLYGGFEYRTFEQATRLIENINKKGEYPPYRIVAVKEAN